MRKRLSPGSIWAYAYLIMPPQSRTRLSGLRAMVNRENGNAEGGSRIWNGRIVCERRVTHILIVSDSPEQKRGINVMLEGEVRRLDAQFFVTQPLEVRKYPQGPGAGQRRHP